MVKKFFMGSIKAGLLLFLGGLLGFGGFGLFLHLIGISGNLIDPIGMAVGGSIMFGCLGLAGGGFAELMHSSKPTPDESKPTC